MTEIEALQGRPDEQGRRVTLGEARGVEHHNRIERLEGRADMDAMLIAVLGRGDPQRGANGELEEALRSSRTIGSAIVVVMARRTVSDLEAFLAAAQTSMGSDRKLRDLAEEVVLTGDVTTSHAAGAPHR